MILLVCFVNTVYATKYALIIAIGDYPTSSGWGDINSAKDAVLIEKTLVYQGFDQKNITTLLDNKASKKGILKALNELKSKLQEGDIVVIHYSGHGQQIFDDNGDEIDDADEALVPYDALPKYTDKYQGENHIRDDLWGNILNDFRNILKSDGQLLVLLDSCNSGSTARGYIARGGQPVLAPPSWNPTISEKKGSGLFERIKVRENAAPMVMFSGATADELNYEYQGIGSLSYAFSRAINELGSDITYRQLFAKITSIMNVIAPKQTPVIEGDVDYVFLKGEYVQQQPYFEILNIIDSKRIKIQAGTLHQIFENTTVHIVPSGVIKMSEDQVIASGVVSNSEFNESVILLDKPLPDTNTGHYWVFINEPSYGDLTVKVYIDKTVTDQRVEEKITKYLSENKLGAVVNDSLLSDVVLRQSKQVIELNVTSGILHLESFDITNNIEGIENINEALFRYAQGQFLKNVSLKGRDYEFSFRLLPVTYNSTKDELEELKKETSYYNDTGTFTVQPQEDYVVLEVTNTGEKPIYFNILEINSKRDISAFLPNDNCKLNDQERKLMPGKRMILKDCYWNFNPPYERLLLKGFASNTPINFTPIIKSRGDTDLETENPLEKFISQSYERTRGGNGGKATGKMEGYTAEFIYEIEKE